MYLKYLTLILLYFSITSLTLAQCPTTNISFNTQADIDNFPINYPECTMIPAGVNIVINNGNMNNLTNLDGLSSLTSIEGNLSIFSNFALTNIDGLSGLTSIRGNLTIEFNPLLTNIDGLSNLTSIEGDLTIFSNDALTNINGLSSLTSIGGSLSIETNNVLTNVDGLSSLISVGGDLFFNFNNALTNVDGLSSLTSVGGELSFFSNEALISVDGLSGLTSIEGNLFFTFNSQLSMCCALCPLFQADAIDDTVIGGTIGIVGNATGCDETTILACTSCMFCDLAVDTQPVSQTSCSGEDAIFLLTTSGGVSPLSYQLQSDCAVAGIFADLGATSTSPMVTISGTTPADACDYRIVVSDSSGCTVTSDVVILTIDSCPDPEIVPTLSEWGLIVLGLMILIIGVISIREQAVVRETI